MEGRININNYEAFLLDYMEGNLSKEAIFELQVFAAQHPHLDIDLNDLELIELSNDEIKFENKENLKKTGISDEKFIAYLENELSAEEKRNIELLCTADEKLARDLKLFKHTILVADQNIIFDNKHQLKKQETKVIWLFSREVLAAAASLILIMGLWFMFRTFTAGNETLNSQKINGNRTTGFIASNKLNSQPAFTIEKNSINANSNNAALINVKEQHSAKENSRLVADNNLSKENAGDPKEDFPLTNTIAVNNTVTATNTVTVNKDNSLKEPVKLANASGAKPFVIVEKAYDEDEKQLASNEKSGFWKKAMKALNGLNKLGVKRVKGTETTESNNEEYLLSMGQFSIENKKYNAE